MATEAQITANRANAQLSSGPSSPEGKARSSHNALKTGLTGRTILLPTDDVAAYEKLVATITTKFQPKTDEEKLLVQSVADTHWRLLRIPTLEAGVYALGRHELAGECAFETDSQVRAAMIEALVFRTYRKDLSNLTLQENRLRKQLEKDKAELAQLQTEVEAVEFHRRNKAMREVIFPINESKYPGSAVEFGFEITKEYLKLRESVCSFSGREALPAFDRAWQAKMREKVA